MTTDERAIHGQLIVDKDIGDCFRASMSYLLGIPNSHDLPNDHTALHCGWQSWLYDYGLAIRWERTACWVGGIWIASVTSKNLAERTHAIVMEEHKVRFDPSPRKRYRKGSSLLGVDVVKGGYQLVVIDPRKVCRGLEIA